MIECQNDRLIEDWPQISSATVVFIWFRTFNVGPMPYLQCNPAVAIIGHSLIRVSKISFCPIYTICSNYLLLFGFSVNGFWMQTNTMKLYHIYRKTQFTDKWKGQLKAFFLTNHTDTTNISSCEQYFLSGHLHWTHINFISKHTQFVSALSIIQMHTIA